MQENIDITEEILNKLSTNGKIDSFLFAKEYNIDHNIVIGKLMSLSSFDEMIKMDKNVIIEWNLTSEGLQIKSTGSYEYQLYSSLPENGLSIEYVKTNMENSDIAIQKALAYKYIKLVKNPEPILFKYNNDILDSIQNDLIKIDQTRDVEFLDKKRVDELKKRKLIQQNSVTSFIVTPGEKFNVTRNKRETDLTSEMINSGSYKNTLFKEYNLISLGVEPTKGSHHPLMKMKSEISQIFLNMGFTEMPTNNFVDSAFWNFDALFQPQQHPARDIQDTFYLKHPKTATLNDVNNTYLNSTKSMHENGNSESLGYRYKWKIEEAEKLILRTHTTAVSVRMLYQLSQAKTFTPAKYFSIDRVFRNEASDSTHLSEFHQIEGVVADRNLGLHHLIGILKAFFSRLGLDKLRFKPAFNPYTEPSLEVFGFHPGLNKWVEVGNSGIFRREMLDPMKFPKDVNVIAWGLSLERPTMIKYGIDNIRSLIGHRIDLKSIANSEICMI